MQFAANHCGKSSNVAKFAAEDDGISPAVTFRDE
jgi:hypothetical protein